jgi:hypothetical protein
MVVIAMGIVIAAAWVAVLVFVVALCYVSAQADKATRMEVAAFPMATRAGREAAPAPAPAPTPPRPRSVGRPAGTMPLVS